MKETFKENFFLSSYRALFLEESFYLRLGDFSVTEYMLKFEELVFRCGFQIYHFPAIYIYMFYSSLRLDFKNEMILQVKRRFFWF